MFYKKTIGDRVFDTFNVLFMLFIILITFYPFYFSLIGSLNVGSDYTKGGVYLFVRKFTLENYRIVFADGQIMKAFFVTSARTIVGTAASVLFTALFAYGFSRKMLMGRNIYAIYCMITMYFSGGLIPYFILVRNLGLMNNFLVYIIPALLSFYNVLIMQSFFRDIPESIIESARIDGAGEYRIFFNLILPLSKPVLATIALFNGVYHWNSFFDAMLFTTKPELQTLQVLLMKVIRTREGAMMMAQMASASSQAYKETTPATIQLATMMVATVPILLLYPFLQKYFVSGLTIGSIKG